MISLYTLSLSSQFVGFSGGGVGVWIKNMGSELFLCVKR